MFWCPGFNKQALKAGQMVQGWFQRLSVGKLCMFSFIHQEKPISALPSYFRRVQPSCGHINRGLHSSLCVITLLSAWNGTCWHANLKKFRFGTQGLNVYKFCPQDLSAPLHS